MAAAADSAATMASQAERDADGVRSDASLGRSGHVPVFVAFDDLGLSGRDLAELAGVTPPTVSKWRAGKARIGGERLAFLTLVLAHLLDEADKVIAMHGELATSPQERARSDSLRLDAAHLDAAKAQLAYQDVLNRDLPAAEVRSGAQCFRVWWESGAAQKLQDKRLRPPLCADVLEVLKKMRTNR